MPPIDPQTGSIFMGQEHWPANVKLNSPETLNHNRFSRLKKVLKEILHKSKIFGFHVSPETLSTEPSSPKFLNRLWAVCITDAKADANAIFCS